MAQEALSFDIPAPQSARDLNRLGSRLGRTQRRSASLDARKKHAIAKTNERFDPQIAALDNEADALLMVIIDYALAHKNELTSTQTVRLGSMVIEWRTDGKGTLVFISSEEDIVARLERLKGGSKHVVVKKSVSKDSLKSDPLTLAELDPMARVIFYDTINVTTLPTPAEAKRGAKKIKRDRRL